MREIKFRAWDKKYNQMVSWDGISKNNIIGSLINNNNRSISNGVLMQFTGLLDKNGIEIYEGDIIEHHYSLTKVIYGRSHNEMGELRESVGFHRVGINNNDLWCTTSMTYGLNSYEVIGNIYEHQHLLG